MTLHKNARQIQLADSSETDKAEEEDAELRTERAEAARAFRSLFRLDSAPEERPPVLIGQPIPNPTMPVSFSSPTPRARIEPPGGESGSEIVKGRTKNENHL